METPEELRICLKLQGWFSSFSPCCLTQPTEKQNEDCGICHYCCLKQRTKSIRILGERIALQGKNQSPLECEYPADLLRVCAFWKVIPSLGLSMEGVGAHSWFP